MRIKMFAIAILIMAAGAGSAKADTIIYQDDFSGSETTLLNGMIPDVEPGSEVWSAKTGWMADGYASAAAGSSTAYLPFTPVTGAVYKFSVDMDIVAAGSTTNNWAAMGFITGTNTSDHIIAQDAMTVYMRQYGLLSITGANIVRDSGAANLYTYTNSATFSMTLDTTASQWTFIVERNGVEVCAWHFTSNPSILGIALSKFSDVEVQFDNLQFLKDEVEPVDGAIYQDVFNGSSGTSLSGMAPDVRPGSEVWAAKDGWTADGYAAAAANSSTAYLPFTPVTGAVYKFSVDMDIVAAGSTTNNWAAMGFITGTNTSDHMIAQDAMTVYMRQYGLLSITGANIVRDSGAANLYTYTNCATFSMTLDTTASQWTVSVERNGVEISAWHFTSNPSILGIALSKFSDVEVSFDNLQFIDLTPEGYEAWTDSWGVDIGSAADDYDGDGVSNLGEYGLGGDPTDNQDKGYIPSFAPDGENMVYVYAQRTNDTGLVYWLETSRDLVSGSWSSTGYSVTGTNTGGAFSFVTNLVPASGPSQFVRLKIEDN